MIIFEFTNKAKSDLLALDPKDQDRILSKLKSLKEHPNILAIIKPIYGLDQCTHRLRIGKIRLLLSATSTTKITILAIGQRGDIYR